MQRQVDAEIPRQGLGRRLVLRRRRRLASVAPTCGNRIQRPGEPRDGLQGQHDLDLGMRLVLRVGLPCTAVQGEPAREGVEQRAGPAHRV